MMTRKKAEYWGLSNHDFKRIKRAMTILGQRLFDNLKPLGFTRYESFEDYLGFTIVKDQNRVLTSVGVYLKRENPIEYEISTQIYDKNQKDGETTILDRLDSLDELSDLIINEYHQLEQDIKKAAL